jgi:hypothetical protein
MLNATPYMRALRWSSQAHNSPAVLVGLAHHERLHPQRVVATTRLHSVFSLCVPGSVTT